MGSVIGGGAAVANGAEMWSNKMWGGVASGAIMGGAMGAVTAVGGAAGMAALSSARAAGFAFMGWKAALATSLTIGTGAGMVSYSAKTRIVSGSWDNWSIAGMANAEGLGAAQAGATFGLAFFGGSMGLFNRNLGVGLTLSKTVNSTGGAVFQIITKPMPYVLNTIMKFAIVSGPSTGVRAGIGILF
jgi:hypothetical protein